MIKINPLFQDIIKFKLDYYDLIKEFDIQLIDSSNNIVNKSKEIYEYNIRVNKDNTAFNISIKIDIKDIFIIKALYKGEVMSLKNTFKINVEFGQCSMFGANLEILPIDKLLLSKYNARIY